MLEYKGIRIAWLGHDTFKISSSDKAIYIDPYRLRKEARDKADLLLISHEHFDHLSVDDAMKVIAADKTVVVTTKSCANGMKGVKVKEVRMVKPWDKVDLQGIAVVEAVPAYNINKINPDTKRPFHPKDAGMVGFVVTVDGVRIYHAGDTDAVEELRNLSNIDVALLPVSGTYVMTADEAVDAVRMIKPRIAIPMHYGTIVGSEKDAERFKSMVKECEVHILKPVDDY
ncbi:MAG: MBL fold metallo-hydrolase [Candidatus Nitrosocaldus sp.]